MEEQNTNNEQGACEVKTWLFQAMASKIAVLCSKAVLQGVDVRGFTVSVIKIIMDIHHLDEYGPARFITDYGQENPDLLTDPNLGEEERKSVYDKAVNNDIERRCLELISQNEKSCEE